MFSKSKNNVGKAITLVMSVGTLMGFCVCPVQGIFGYSLRSQRCGHMPGMDCVPSFYLYGDALTLNSQVSIFEKTIGKGNFIFDTYLRTSVPCDVLLAFLKQINLMLGKYPNITAKYRDYCLTERPFIITGCKNAGAEDVYAAVNFPESFLVISGVSCSDLKKLDDEIGDFSKAGIFASCDEDSKAKYVIAHEMGHLFQNILLAPTSVKEIRDLSYLSKVGDGSREAALALMKEDVIRIAREKFGYVGDGDISKQGAMNLGDWFAEVCAHAFCSREPNALGKAMLAFLKEQDGKLGDALATIAQEQ